MIYGLFKVKPFAVHQFVQALQLDHMIGLNFQQFPIVDHFGKKRQERLKVHQQFVEIVLIFYKFCGQKPSKVMNRPFRNKQDNVPSGSRPSSSDGWSASRAGCSSALSMATKPGL